VTVATAIQAHLGLTGKDAAERVGEHPVAWSMYCRGKRDPSAHKIQCWLDRLGLTLTWGPAGRVTLT
jgi:transcriptional regulator with XRE-family HTH domain